jgi:hypothetical protein
MMVALDGQHTALETKALVKRMPCCPKRERVFGMYLRSSLRMSSARMNTMFGLGGATGAVGGSLVTTVATVAVGGPLVTTEHDNMAKAIVANKRAALVNLITLL